MIGELAALGAALTWTFSAILYKEALLKTKPISANIMRLTCTSAILIICLTVIGKIEILTILPLNAVFLACMSGIIGLGFGDTLYMHSLKLIGVARTVPITCIYPLFNLLWAIFLLEEPVTAPIVLGAFIIVFGIALLSSKEKEENTQKTHKGNLGKGVASALITALMWSVSITLMDMAVTLPETDSLDNALAINTIRTMAIAVLLLATSPITDRKFGFLKMQRKTLAMLISGGIIALGLGWFFLAYSFIYASEAHAVPISSTTPLFSTLSATIFLHETATPKNIVGAIMVVAGIFLIFAF
ncbi:MAG: DMT family transporter [Candidatus Bathyarchaeota archaeon]|jgi:drug/metabolite transporter (DMT)-like permease|nr:DMT family transporter [Candidatus Bathyarchaeota archaeon]